MRRALLLVLALALGCRAPTKPPAAPLAAESNVRRPAPGRYVVDAEHSRFDALGAGTLAGHFRLRFTSWKATIDVANDGVGMLNVVVDTASVEVDKAAATDVVKVHLLEVDRFPKATLVGKLVPNGTDYAIDGTADLHGYRVPLRIAGKLQEDGTEWVFRTSFPISRKAFAIKYTPIEPLVKDEVRIVVVARVRASGTSDSAEGSSAPPLPAASEPGLPEAKPSSPPAQ